MRDHVTYPLLKGRSRDSHTGPVEHTIQLGPPREGMVTSLTRGSACPPPTANPEPTAAEPVPAGAGDTTIRSVSKRARTGEPARGPGRHRDRRTGRHRAVVAQHPRRQGARRLADR